GQGQGQEDDLEECYETVMEELAGMEVQLRAALTLAVAPEPSGQHHRQGEGEEVSVTDRSGGAGAQAGAKNGVVDNGGMGGRGEKALDMSDCRITSSLPGAVTREGELAGVLW
ncbi:unnamed protein product, partial [Discosporangium mesarthrocarpum]